MKTPSSVAELEQMSDSLQAAHDEAQVKLQDAQAEYNEASAALVKFRKKYGRVLQMMREDE